HRLFRTFGLSCAEVLADERRRRIRKADGRQKSEHHHPDPDLIACNRRRPESRYDAHEPDPARRLYKELQHSRRRDLYELQEPLGFETPVFTADRDTPVPEEKAIRRVQRTARAADRRTDRRTRYAEFRKETDTENKARPENDVQNIREPKHAHCDRRIARTAKDRVQQEKRKHDDVAAEHYP